MRGWGSINAATPLGLAGLLLLLLLDLSLLVEDLLRLAVADEKDNRGEDEDDGAPGGAVAEAEGVDASGSWNKRVGLNPSVATVTNDKILTTMHQDIKCVN